MKYRIKKVVERISLRSGDEMPVVDNYPWYEHSYWCVQVHVFAWIWITVKAFRSDIFERDGKYEDYGEWLAQELKDKLEEEE